MLSWLAINYNVARLGIEAQNVMAFRLLRMVGNAGKLAPDETGPDLVTALPDEPLASEEPIAPLKTASREVKRRASASKVHKKTVGVKKRTKRSK